MRPLAAHHAHVGGHPVPLEPAAIEHPIVGGHVLLVGDLEPGRVAIEAVGVLHDEFPRAQHTGPRTGLVALLDLEVVEDHR